VRLYVSELCVGKVGRVGHHAPKRKPSNPSFRIYQTVSPRTPLNRARRRAGASLLQQLQRPPSEEVEHIAMGVLGADIERRVLIPYQRGLLEEVA
jgi:hypothetical protein